MAESGFLRLAVGATGTAALRLLGVGFGFLITVLLSRLLGADGIGAYFIAFAWLQIGAVVCIAGADKVILARAASALELGDVGLARSLFRRLTQATIGRALVCAVVAFPLLLVMAEPVSQTVICIAIALLALPLRTLLLIVRAKLLTVGVAVAGAAIELVLLPAVMLLGVAAWLWLVGSLSAPSAVALHVAATLVVCVVMLLIWRPRMPSALRDQPARYATGAWLAEGLPFLAISLMPILAQHLGVLLLGAMAVTSEAGQFGAAARLATLVALPQAAMNPVLAPALARAYARGGSSSVEPLAQAAALMVLASALPPALLFLLAPEACLSLLGAEFVSAAPLLQVLVFGWLLNIAAGSVGAVLMMTGHGRDAAFATAAGTLIGLVLALLLIGRYGAMGAAMAMAAANCVGNLAMAVQVRQRLGIATTALLNPARLRTCLRPLLDDIRRARRSEAPGRPGDEAVGQDVT